MKHLFFLFALVVFCTGGLLTAQQVDKSFYFDYGEKFYYDIVNVPSPRPDSTRFHVFFRMRNDLLPFRSINSHYEAAPLLYVEFIDSTGVIRLSREWRDTVSAGMYEETQSKKLFVRDAMTVDLPPGTYTVLFELGDNAAPRTSRFKVNGVKGRSFTTGSTVIAQPLFVEAVPDREAYRPFILKGDITFPSDMRALISVAGTLPGDRYEYTVKQDPGAEKDLHPDDPLVAFTTVSGTVRPEPGIVPAIARDSNAVLVWKESFEEPEQMAVTGRETTPEATPGMGLLDIALPGGTMSSGRYILEVYKQGSTDTLVRPFALVWENKPLSLRNIQYAVELAYYVMSDDEYDQVNSGSLEAKRQKLYSFWRERDPVMTTVFNEAMAEYYSRVDYAYFNFQTLAERDGARTERGKIYILHGPPTSVERRLEPNKPAVEVWRYDNNVAREFIFESPSPGIFVLKGIQKI